jgi:hypothetical protein
MEKKGFPHRKRPCPRDILQDIAWYISNSADLCSFARCNTTTWAIGEEKLWKRDAVCYGKPALYSAIENHDLLLAENALTWYAKLKGVNTQGLLDGTAVQWTTFHWKDGIRADNRSGSPVMLAVEFGNMDMLKLVVSKGCDLNMRCREIAWGFAVHEICSPALCRCHYYSDNGSRVEGPDSCETALHFAVWNGRPDMLRFLLEAGAEVGYKGRWQETRTPWDCTVFLRDSVLARAAKAGFHLSCLGPVHTEMMKILAEFGVNISTREVGHPAQHRLTFWR